MVSQKGKNSMGEKCIKSPSDTTLYAPALNKRNMPQRIANDQLVANINNVSHGKKIRSSADRNDLIANTKLDAIKIAK